MKKTLENITTALWREVPALGDPFSAEQCFCAGYDVYGDMLQKASWIEYLFLLLTREKPNEGQRQLLNGIAIALANPGPRDHSIQAAMSAGAGGSGSAAALMAALAVGAGSYGGAREVLCSMNVWAQCGTDITQWCEYLQQDFPLPEESENLDNIWPLMEHPPGFVPYARHVALPVRQTLAYLSQLNVGPCLPWLQQEITRLECAANMPISMTNVASAAFMDLSLEVHQGEMLYLLLRLPGAAVHAIEQYELGWKKYPFHSDGLTVTNDPAKAS